MTLPGGAEWLILLLVTLPGGAEWLILLLTILVPFGLIVGVIVLVRRTSKTRGEVGGRDGQRPPPGYWWDGEKWNPPAD